MGGFCSCENLANKLQGTSMTLLCVCLSIYSWWAFDHSVGLSKGGIKDCANQNYSDLAACQALAGAGTLSLLGALVALFGTCSGSPEKNQSTISAAFGLLNLAYVVIYLHMYHNADCTDQDLDQKPCSIWMASGIFNIVGFLMGIIHALYTCKSGVQHIRMYIASFFFYLLSQANQKWYLFDLNDCSTDSIKEGENFTDGPGQTSLCVSEAFAGSFIVLAMVLCLVAAVIALCRTDAEKQSRIQQAVLAFCLGMACLAWTCDFWFWYGHAEVYGVSKCSEKNPQESNSSFCVSMALGAIISMLGFPLALFTAFAFCCGCMKKDGTYGGNNFDV